MFTFGSCVLNLLQATSKFIQDKATTKIKECDLQCSGSEQQSSSTGVPLCSTGDCHSSDLEMPCEKYASAHQMKSPTEDDLFDIPFCEQELKRFIEEDKQKILSCPKNTLVNTEQLPDGSLTSDYAESASGFGYNCVSNEQESYDRDLACEETVNNESRNIDSYSSDIKSKCDSKSKSESTDDVNERFNVRKVSPDCKIFIGNISYRVSKKQLAEFFSRFGNVVFCEIVKEHIKRRSKGIAFVGFETLEQAAGALNAPQDELMLDGRELRVHRAEEKQRVVARRHKPWQPTDINDKMETYNDNMCEANGMNINKLTDNCLLHIFGYLSVKQTINMERVCHRWRYIALKTWQSRKCLNFKGFFPGFGRSLTDKKLKSILTKGCKMLETLDLSHSHRLLTDWTIDIIGQNCPNLVHLDISGVAVTNLSLKVLGQKCTNLQIVKLRSCYSVGEKGLWWLFHRCKQLRHIDLTNIKKLSGKCFHMLGDKLETITMNGCSKLKDDGLEELSSRCMSLHDINIDECPHITIAGVRALSKNCPNITVLYAGFSFPASMSINSWTPLGQFHQLRELSLPHNYNCDDAVLAEVGKICENLRYLDISGCHVGVTDAGVSCLAACRNLENLKISYLHKVSNYCLDLFALHCPLKILEACGCSLISDSGLIALAIHCLSLIKLDVSGCMEVTPASLKAFMEERTRLQIPEPFEFIVGGTCIETYNKTEAGGANMEVNLGNNCANRLRADREFELDSEWALDDKGSETDVENDDGDGVPVDVNRSIIGEYQGHYNDWQEDWLEGDDPLYDDYWNLS